MSRGRLRHDGQRRRRAASVPADRRRHARLRLHGQGAHQRATRRSPYMIYPPPLRPGWWRSPAATRRRWPRRRAATASPAHVTDWRELRRRRAVQLFDNCGPNNLHAEPTIAAAEAGKHVLCEKPLGRDAAESKATWQRVQAAGVKHMCAFNYRFVPGRPAGAPADRARRARRDLPLPRRLPAGVDRRPRRRWSGASTRRPAGSRRARRPRRAHHRPGALPGRRDRRRCPALDRHLPARPRGRRRLRGDGRVRERRGRHARGVALLPRAQERLPWEINGSKGSIALRPRALQRARGHCSRATRDARASAPCWSRRPTTRSGSTGGRTGTSSAGSTPSSTRSTTC